MEMAVRSKGITRSVGELAEGDEGTAQTIASIQAVIDHAVFTAPSQTWIAAIARDLLQAGGNDAGGFAAELWQWARQTVVFKRDPQNMELVRHPGDLLKAIAKSGQAECDCDDLATLLASIIAAAGLRPVLITVGRRARPKRFQHIFVGIRVGEGLTADDIIPLDPQEGTPAGVWPAIAKRVKYWSVTVTQPK